MKLSIVTTLYHSSPYIDEFYRRATRVAQQFANEDYEILFVNDGSPDNSSDLVLELTKDPHVVLYDLSRNFGHHKAMRLGLEKSRGEFVFLVDSDLEEEPEWLFNFYDQMQVENVDVVYGVQNKRKGSWFEKWSGHVYYRLLDYLLSIKHPRSITTVRLMTRRYVNAFLEYKEVETIISCLWVITGFKQSEQVVKKHWKKSTTYGLLKKLHYLANTITSFSTAPLMLIFFCGVGIFLIAIFYAILLIIKRFLMAGTVDGWTSIMVSIWILGGMIISFIGTVGIYLSKIFLEVKQRPYAIVRSIHGRCE